MPSLQIKDCPQGVYDDLKLCALQEDRSMAQQALHIIREYLKAYGEGYAPSEVENCCDRSAVQERDRQREALLKSVPGRKRITEVPAGYASVADMIRAQRNSETGAKNLSKSEVVA